MTEPIALPGSLRRGMDELVFEEFGFASYYSAPPAVITPLSREQVISAASTVILRVACLV